MRITRPRVTAVLLATAVFTASIVSFALGGPSVGKFGYGPAHTSAKGKRGPAGPAGPTGPQGPQGARGPGTIVVTGTLASPGVLTAGQCLFPTQPQAAVLITDHIIITAPRTWSSGNVTLVGTTGNGEVDLTICNESGASVDFGTASDIKFMVLRA